MSPLATFLLKNETDLDRIRAFLGQLPHKHRLVDFEERMQIESIRARVRVWERVDQIIALAYVDMFNNLWFEITPSHAADELEQAVLNWGLACIRRQNEETGDSSTLDFSCDAKDNERLAFAERFGFVRESIHTLKYSCPLAEPPKEFSLPAGYSIRCATGESEVDALVALHRAAFGTENMTVEERLAIMRAPGYIPELDLLAVAPDSSLAAFCVCGFEEGESTIGYTDPIGVHPRHQKIGLGKAIVSAGLRALQSRGAKIAELGTSSENIAMQKLAEGLGFICASEKVWFAKAV